MATWTAGEVLGFDFETTGIDRFNDVPVSYALVHVVGGVVRRSWSGLIDPGREIPAGATEVHGITTERARDEGMPLREAIGLVTDAVVSASLRGVPLAGMKLDYDLTILDTQAKRLCRPRHRRAGLVRARARLRRHRPPLRPLPQGPADAGQPVRALRHRHRERSRCHRPTRSPPSRCSSRSRRATRRCGNAIWPQLHENQARWHRGWAHGYDEWRISQGMIPIDPRDYEWPVAPVALPAAA